MIWRVKGGGSGRLRCLSLYEVFHLQCCSFIYLWNCINLFIYLLCFKKKKIWNRIDCQRSEKKIHNTQEIKRTFLIGRNRTKRAHFRGSPLFQAMYNIKTEKQTINSTYLSSVRCFEAAERKRLVRSLKSVLLISCVFWIYLLYCCFSVGQCSLARKWL